MSGVFRSQSPLTRALHVALCAYIAIWLAGCAGAPPKPEGDKLTQLQVRRYPAPFKTVFNAAVDATQNLEFTVDLANADAGVITATRQTNERLARITSDDKGLPTWAWVALIATGVIIIAAVVVILSSHDDEKDKDKKKDQAASKEKKGQGDEGGSKDKEKASRHGRIPGENDRPAHKDTVRVKYKEKAGSEAEHHHREESGGGGLLAYYAFEEPETDFIVIGDDSPQSTEWHQYRITLHFDSTAEAGTKVRLSVQGAKLDGSEVEEAGPVYDPQFYDKFFANLERSLKMEMPDSSWR